MGYSFGKIIDNLTAYIQLKTEQVRLTIIRYISRILANVIALSLLAMIGCFFLFFLSFSMGAYLNEMLQSMFLGHLIVAGIYLLLIIIVLVLIKTKKIQNWLESLILKIAEQQDEQED